MMTKIKVVEFFIQTQETSPLINKLVLCVINSFNFLNCPTQNIELQYKSTEHNNRTRTIY